MDRSTAQKELVKRIVYTSCDHPTAETVYERARDEISNISLGTVYRVLRQLAEAGEVFEVCVDGAPNRFDKTLGEHAHFVCKKCGKVTDIDADVEGMLKAVRAHCPDSIESACVNFYGVCERCRSNHIASANV